MRILHVAESTDGGVGVFVAALVQRQLGHGDEVGVAAPSAGPVPGRLVAAGARHLAWEATPQPGRTVPGELRSLARTLRAFDPDVVHLHSSKAGFVGRLLVRGRRPTILQPHAWSFFAREGKVRDATLAWERAAARWAHVVLCVSEDERRLGREAGVAADYRVLPNGVNLEHFPRLGPGARSAARRALGLGDGPLVVCAGRLHRQKNQHGLLDAWPAVRAAVPGARLVLVGDGPDGDALRARAVEGVELVGSTDDVRPWFAAASLVAQPSRWEGMSLSLLEAMACGRSVVVSDVPGMAEVVTGGVGALVPPEDASALARAICERLADRARADAEGAAGRARIEAHHDRDTQHEGIDRLYAELTGGTATGREGRLRTLVVQPFADHGGSESWLARLLDATDELEVSVLLLKDGPFRAELERRGIPVRVRPVGTSPLDVLRPALRLARELRADPPDVVLGNVLKAQLVAGPAGRLAGVPTVWAKHDHSYDRWLAVPVGRISNRVVGAVEELAEPTGRTDAVIIPPPRPEREPASREDARAFLAARGLVLGDQPTAIMAGRLVPFKGVDDAIRAIALPAAAAWRLVVAGTDDHSAPGETERLRGLAAELGVADRVQFLGHVPEVSHWFAAFDALAVLTKPGARRAPAKEGFGTSAFEAMLAGIPVVAVEGGAVVRRLYGRAGFGVPPADPEAVAQALGRLTDPAARAAAGAAGREIVADAPDAAACARMLVDVLADAAGDRRSRDR